jgi:hypothetical protein
MDAEQRRHLCRQFDLRSENVLILGDLDPEPIAMRTIPDPFDQSEGFFQVVYERIGRCATELARALGGRERT